MAIFMILLLEKLLHIIKSSIMQKIEGCRITVRTKKNYQPLVLTFCSHRSPRTSIMDLNLNQPKCFRGSCATLKIALHQHFNWLSIVKAILPLWSVGKSKFIKFMRLFPRELGSLFLFWGYRNMIWRWVLKL